MQGGGARVHTYVTERPVEETVSLHEEHVTVDRRPVDRAATEGDMAFKEGTINVTETSEVPVVAKEARVVEEVVVGKTATDRTETVRDTVRRTDVDGGGPGNDTQRRCRQSGCRRHFGHHPHDGRHSLRPVSREIGKNDNGGAGVSLRPLFFIALTEHPCQINLQASYWTLTAH